MAEKKSLNWPFFAWLLLIGAGLAVGIWGAIILLTQGHVVTGSSDQVPLGVFIPAYVFFVAASAGCVTVSLGYVIGFKSLELVMKRAVLLAIVTLIPGGMFIILDLGSPLNTIYFMLSPNFGSPMWWMSVFYTLYLVLLLLDFYFLHTRNMKMAATVGVMAPLSAIAVHSTLGMIFGFASTRTYFGGAFAPVYFIVIAIVIGTALLLFVTSLQYRVTGNKMKPELQKLIVSLGKFLGLVLGVVILFTVWKNLTGLSSSVESTAMAYRYMMFGPAAWWYWSIVVISGLAIPFVLMLNARTRNLNGILVASFLVLIGMFAARLEFNFGGQIVAQVQNLQHLQWPFTSYSVTLVEIAVLTLGLAVAALLYTAGNRMLALDEVPYHD